MLKLKGSVQLRLLLLAARLVLLGVVSQQCASTPTRYFKGDVPQGTTTALSEDERPQRWCTRLAQATDRNSQRSFGLGLGLAIPAALTIGAGTLLGPDVSATGSDLGATLSRNRNSVLLLVGGILTAAATYAFSHVSYSADAAVIAVSGSTLADESKALDRCNEAYGAVLSGRSALAQRISTDVKERQATVDKLTADIKEAEAKAKKTSGDEKTKAEEDVKTLKRQLELFMAQ